MSEIMGGIRETPAPAWQPIETAPKDGRRALVYRPLARMTHDEPVAVKRLMSTHQGCWAATVPEGSEPFNPTDGSCHVTHWMPIPEPPESSGQNLADANSKNPPPQKEQQHEP